MRANDIIFYILMGALVLAFGMVVNLMIGDPFNLLSDTLYIEEWKCLQPMRFALDVTPNEDFSTWRYFYCSEINGDLQFQNCFEYTDRNYFGFPAKCDVWIKTRMLKEDNT